MNRLIRTVHRVSRRLPRRWQRRSAESLARQFHEGCVTLCEPQQPDAPTVLVFSAGRFREDLEVLTETGALRLVATPTELLQAVNGLYKTVPDIDQYDDYQYFLEETPHILNERERLRDFCIEVVAALRRHMAFDCAITPAVHYRYEHPWAAAFRALSIPFIALHKEFTVLDERHLPVRIERYRRQKRTFYGSHVLVMNETARKLFAGSGMAPAENVEVVGMPRMDRLISSARQADAGTHDAKQVTLFSFAHYSGDLHPGERRSKLFSAHDHEGFVRLFRDTHVAFAELALKHPSVEFKIKPKNVVDWWIVEIERVVEEALGLRLADIANLNVVNERAPDLIRESDFVIGFNSTVLLESLVLGRPTIVPLFAEAVDTYPDNVYLRDCLDVFRCARSKEDLMDAVEQVIAGEPIQVSADEARIDQVICKYLGFNDAQSAMRVASAIRRCLPHAEEFPSVRLSGKNPQERVA